MAATVNIDLIALKLLLQYKSATIIGEHTLLVIFMIFDNGVLLILSKSIIVKFVMSLLLITATVRKFFNCSSLRSNTLSLYDIINLSIIYIFLRYHRSGT